MEIMDRKELRRRLAQRPNAVRFEELERYLNLCGWTLDRVRGSHHVYMLGKSRLVVPLHRPHALAVYVRSVRERTWESGDDDA